ncbi:hypothetical protein AF70_00059080 [Pseudomonas sp. KD5]|uniref:Uncharacterized protein n=1 Tax=Pseudomonas umsongensis TaxID=198618 RepID=A0ACC5M7V4_9PSED|nr:hypothetical protein [Pseudomonas umsongensis]NMN80293.1 hypothetical protein [Pseudomonas sp. KD5]
MYVEKLKKVFPSFLSISHPAITMYLIAGYDLFESKAHFQSEPNGGAFQAAINLH